MEAKTHFKKLISEEIVFTPFNENALKQLTEWILKDDPEEVKISFTPNIYYHGQINKRFLTSFLTNNDSELNGSFVNTENSENISMLATIKTSYHTLMNIGFVQIKQCFTEPSKTSYINIIYLSKPFRQKDYEYHILRKLVDFTVRNLQCDLCMIWISVYNYLFLSIARTLGFRLTKLITHPLTGATIRYCYAITNSNLIPKRLQENLSKNYAIELPIRSKSRPVVPDMEIPHYLWLKKNLIKLNRNQGVPEGFNKRKHALYYSPILRLQQYKYAKNSIPSNYQHYNENQNADEYETKLNEICEHCKRREIIRKYHQKYASPEKIYRPYPETDTKKDDFYYLNGVSRYRNKKPGAASDEKTSKKEPFWENSEPKNQKKGKSFIKYRKSPDEDSFMGAGEIIENQYDGFLPDINRRRMIDNFQ